MHCIYLSDRLSVSAYICCLISVIGISAKSCIGAPLLIANLCRPHISAYTPVQDLMIVNNKKFRGTVVFAKVFLGLWDFLITFHATGAKT